MLWAEHHRSPAQVFDESASVAVASWFDDAGATACGTHLSNGYAHLPGSGWDCGARVRFCYRDRCVVGVREDSGPYVAGRDFDLTPSLKAALGCTDLCGEEGTGTLYWRRL